MTRGAIGLLLASVALTASGAASCAKGPVYGKPTPQADAGAPLPESFKEVDGWKGAQPADQALRGAWWEAFGDPALNELEARVNVSNETLRSADARFRQARALIRVNRSALYPTIST